MLVKKFLYSRWIYLIILLWLPSVYAEALDNELFSQQLAQFQTQINTIQNQLKDQTLTESDLLTATKTLSEINNKINLTVANIETETKKITGQITSLGEAIEGEPSNVKEKRKSLQQEKLDAEKWLSQYRVFALRSEELLSSAKNQLNTLLADRLLHKGPSVTDLTHYVLNNLPQLGKVYLEYFISQHGLNIMEFVNQFNKATAKMEDGMIVPTEVTVYKDATFHLKLKSPPVSYLIKKAAGIMKGSGEPNKTKVGKLSKKQVEEIAKAKMEDLNTTDIEMAKRIVSGSARSMGVEIK